MERWLKIYTAAWAIAFYAVIVLVMINRKEILWLIQS